MKNTAYFSIAALALLALIAPKNASAEDATPSAYADGKTLLMNAKCPITGDDAQPDQYVEYADAEHGVFGRFYLCCPSCVEAVKGADQKELYAKVFLTKKDGKQVEYGKALLTIENSICTGTGEEIGSSTTTMIYNGAQIKLCCPGCDKQTAENPEKALGSIRADVEKAVKKMKEEAAKS